MCDFIARMTCHVPLRHLAVAGLVGLLLTGLLPAPLNAARGGTSPGAPNAASAAETNRRDAVVSARTSS